MGEITPVVTPPRRSVSDDASLSTESAGATEADIGADNIRGTCTGRYRPLVVGMRPGRVKAAPNRSDINHPVVASEGCEPEQTRSARRQRPPPIGGSFAK